LSGVSLDRAGNGVFWGYKARFALLACEVAKIARARDQLLVFRSFPRQLKRPLALADVKHMLLGHWGTTPGQNFIYAHLNRVIKKYDLNMIYVSGPGHGGPAVVANTYLEGTCSEIYPDISQDEAGLRKLFIQFSFPGGIPSHASQIRGISRTV
jgi:phosphoketolase